MRAASTDRIETRGTASRHPTGDRRGFALPVAIFALVVVGLLVTGGFYVARQEARVGMASEHGGLAVYVAERGIAETMEDWDPNQRFAMAQWAVDTVTGATDEGTWIVEVQRTGAQTFFLNGEGTVTEGGGMYGGASRHVGLLVRSIVPDLDPPAALTTRGQTTMSGSSEVAGGDSTFSGWETLGLCDPDSLDDKPGLLTNDTTQVDNRGEGNVTGDPPMAQDTTISDSTFTVFGDMTWDELVSMATITLAGTSGMNDPAPTYVDGDLMQCDTSDPWNWGNPYGDPATDDCATHFPIIHITGDRATFQGGGLGQGILLVDGALDLRGGFEFHGIIIVQGSFETQGSGNRVYGGVMASNALFDSQNITGGSVVQNSTCATDRAVSMNSSLARPRPLEDRSWVDLSATQ